MGIGIHARNACKMYSEGEFTFPKMCCGPCAAIPAHPRFKKLVEMAEAGIRPDRPYCAEEKEEKVLKKKMAGPKKQDGGGKDAVEEIPGQFSRSRGQTSGRHK